MREFETGATRNSNTNKLDYSGFLHPGALKIFAIYMHRHRLQADGKLRASDNWQKGIPGSAYMESLIRHIWDIWLLDRDCHSREDKINALCGIMFNVQGLLLEELRKDPTLIDLEWEE